MLQTHLRCKMAACKGIICAQASEAKPRSFIYPSLAGYADHMARIHRIDWYDSCRQLCTAYNVWGIGKEPAQSILD